MRVRTRSLALAAAVAAGAIPLAACGGSSSSTPDTAATTAAAAGTTAAAADTLTGTVGPGFTIDLKQGGADVTTLPAGTYSVTVDDQSAAHNFAFVAPDGTITRVTSVPETGTKTATVTLTKGDWVYECEPHASSMRGTFTVT